MTFSSIFSVVCGVGMVGHWALSYFRDQIPELESEPIRIGFHLAAEAATALMLIISGVGLWIAAAWSQRLYPVAVGMLFYTAIVSPGYFAQQGKWVWLAPFGCLLLLGSISLVLVV